MRAPHSDGQTMGTILGVLGTWRPNMVHACSAALWDVAAALARVDRGGAAACRQAVWWRACALAARGAA